MDSTVLPDQPAVSSRQSIGKENEMASLNAKEMAEVVRRHGPFEVWVGVMGYDTRPNVGADPLPVAHTKAFAEAFREPEEVPEWHLEEAVESLGVGEVVTIPEYWGCNYEGEENFVRTDEGFMPLGYRRGG